AINEVISSLGICSSSKNCSKCFCHSVRISFGIRFEKTTSKPVLVISHPITLVLFLFVIEWLAFIINRCSGSLSLREELVPINNAADTPSPNNAVPTMLLVDISLFWKVRLHNSQQMTNAFLVV